VTGTAPLMVVVSATCATCRYTLRLVEALRRLRPWQMVEVIDLDDPEVVVPDGVVGTPTFLLGERVVSLGNPTVEDLLATLDGAAP
jgi:Thioredoxin domain